MNGDVAGYCPMGCGKTLFLADGGYITCSYVHCRQPDAVVDILADPQTEHVVTFYGDGFTVKHPLRERLNDAILSCKLHTFCATLPGPPPQVGIYRVVKDKVTWRFQLIT